MKRFMLVLLAAGLMTVSVGTSDAQAQRIRVGAGGIVYRGGGPYRSYNNYNYNRAYRNNYNAPYNYGGYYGGGYGPRYYGNNYRVPPGYYSNNFGVNPYGVYFRF